MDASGLPSSGREALQRDLVFLNPSNDSLFEHVVRSEVRTVRERGASLRSSRRQLRLRYPHSDLYRQRDVAVKGRPTEIWFAYRDGRQRSSGPSEPWWEGRGVARGVVDRDGRLTRPNEALRRLLRIPRARRTMLLTRDYLPAGVCADLAGARGAPPEPRSEGSTAFLPATDGGGRELDFHVVWQGAGRHRHRLMMRSSQDRQRAAVGRAVGESSLRSFPLRRRLIDRATV